MKYENVEDALDAIIKNDELEARLTDYEENKDLFTKEDNQEQIKSLEGDLETMKTKYEAIKELYVSRFKQSPDKPPEEEKPKKPRYTIEDLARDLKR